VSLETEVLDDVEGRVDDLIELTAALIALDTTARDVHDPPRDEAPLQELLADRLREAGARIDLWEPRPDDVAGHRMTPAGLGFEGRPQLVAHLPGAGGGKSLLLNGHIDVVSSEPRERWTSDPNAAEIRHGRLYGRGACDMKGGVAAIVVAVDALSSVGARLRGDLTVCTVTDEESTGCGALAALAHGVRADASIVTEPSTLDAWVACRGALIATVTVLGRPGHAGMHHADWRDGGAVNAIDKALVIVDALRRLESEWRSREDYGHRLLPGPDIVATGISAGEWTVSYPASCRLTFHIAYVPGQADDDGWGSEVMADVTRCVDDTAAGDTWLAEHPPTIQWAPEVPPAEVDERERIVRTAVAAGQRVGRPSRPTGFHSWYDGATFTKLGSIPSIGFGPGSLDVAHTVDEFVPIDDLVDCAKALALSAIRFCGTSET
jgi:acetylornithine deacetylase